MHFFLSTVLTFLAIRLITAAVFISSTIDLQNLWYAGCLLDQSDICNLSERQIREGMSMLRSYPPWSLPFLTLFGLFTLDTLKDLWLLLSQLGFAISAGLISVLYKELHKSMAFIYPVFCLMLWYPIYNHLMVGQLTVIQLLGFLGFLILFGKNRYYSSGFFLLISAIKPQTLWLFYFLLFIPFTGKRLKILLSFALTCLLLSALGIYLRSDLVTGLWPIKASESTVIAQPNLGSFLQLYIGLTGRFLPCLSIMAYCLLTRWPGKMTDLQIIHNPNLMRILTLSLLCAPYSNIHDMILYIIPLCALIAEAKGKLSEKQFTVFIAAFLTALLILMAIAVYPHNQVTIEYFAILALVVHAIFEIFYKLISICVNKSQFV